MRICLVYDCLFPHTVGGAERWYRRLAERLAAEGHEVTYVTLRQWERGADPGVDGVRVVTAGPRMALYVRGRRRILPPLVFGLGVLWHLLRHGRRYDAVHTCSFPYFSLLAAALVRPLRRYALVVDWFEVWSRDYWRRYLGGPGGLVGWTVQRLCMRPRQRAFCFSRLHERRLRAQGFAHPLDVLPGIYAGPTGRPRPVPAEPVVVFAGRHIPEKRVPALVPAVARAREQVPGLRAEIYGDGPDRPAVLAAIAAAGLDGAVSAPGFVESETLEHALARALCMVLPSEREGFGLVVVEACAQGVPAVVVAAPDNAATELVDDGVNGAIARSPAPADLADAIVRVHAAGAPLRESTAEWFAERGAGLSLDRSLAAVVESYTASARS
jgi:glycosyltransferase involved in cell wall biosynthesis